MDLYPAIDLRGGRIVRLTEGDFNQETHYGDDPIAVAQDFVAQGAPWIHVVDLDAAKGDGPINAETIKAIAAAVDVPVQTGGGQVDDSSLKAGVRRIVLTSSVAAIFGDNADLHTVPGGVFTEEHWNTSSSVDHQPYSYSKVAAEREAWKIHNAQSRWDLVTINPSLVLGPSMTRASASTSLTTMKQLVDGTMFLGAPDLPMGVVDVRDVAMAHIQAGYTMTAKGRHIVSGEISTPFQMGQILRKRYGGKYLLPLMQAPKLMVWAIAPVAGLQRRFVELNVGHPLRIDNGKGRRELGLNYRPFEQTLTDHFEQMLDDGIVRRR